MATNCNSTRRPPIVVYYHNLKIVPLSEKVFRLSLINYNKITSASMKLENKFTIFTVSRRRRRRFLKAFVNF